MLKAINIAGQVLHDGEIRFSLSVSFLQPGDYARVMLDAMETCSKVVLGRRVQGRLPRSDLARRRHGR